MSSPAEAGRSVEEEASPQQQFSIPTSFSQQQTMLGVEHSCLAIVCDGAAAGEEEGNVCLEKVGVVEQIAEPLRELEVRTRAGGQFLFDGVVRVGRSRLARHAGVEGSEGSGCRARSARDEVRWSVTRSWV